LLLRERSLFSIATGGQTTPERQPGRTPESRLSDLRFDLLDESQDGGLYGLRGEMKKSILLALDDEEILDLIRIVSDNDAEGGLAFLKEHFKGKTHELLESG
jgi:hypothetical protein